MAASRRFGAPGPCAYWQEREGFTRRRGQLPSTRGTARALNASLGVPTAWERKRPDVSGKGLIAPYGARDLSTGPAKIPGSWMERNAFAVRDPSAVVRVSGSPRPPCAPRELRRGMCEVQIPRLAPLTRDDGGLAGAVGQLTNSPTHQLTASSVRRSGGWRSGGAAAYGERLQSVACVRDDQRVAGGSGGESDAGHVTCGEEAALPR